MGPGLWKYHEIIGLIHKYTKFNGHIYKFSLQKKIKRKWQKNKSNILSVSLSPPITQRSSKKEEVPMASLWRATTGQAEQPNNYDGVEYWPTQSAPGG